MKIFNIEDLPKEINEKYKKIIDDYKFNTIYYIEDKLDMIGIDQIKIDDYTLKLSKSFISILPIKQYFTIVLESKSRENVKEPCWSYRLYILDKLLEKENSIMGD